MRNTLILAGAVILTLIAAYLWVSRLKATDEGPSLWLTPWSTALAVILWVGWVIDCFAAQNSN
jgi:hypothetical protein